MFSCYLNQNNKENFNKLIIDVLSPDRLDIRQDKPQAILVLSRFPFTIYCRTSLLGLSHWRKVRQHLRTIPPMSRRQGGAFICLHSPVWTKHLIPAAGGTMSLRRWPK